MIAPPIVHLIFYPIIKIFMNATKLVFILDKREFTAEMEGCAIDEFNSTLEKQEEVDVERRITTVFFGNRYGLLHAGWPVLRQEKKYQLGDSTASLNSIRVDGPNNRPRASSSAYIYVPALSHCLYYVSSSTFFMF